MWYGNTSQNIRNLFIEIESNEPAIVMIDEIDAFLSRRTSLRDPSGDECHIRTVAQFLNYMDGLESNNKRIVILGATNRLDNLDPQIALSSWGFSPSWYFSGCTNPTKANRFLDRQ